MESGTLSRPPTWMARAQELGSYSDAFSGALAGSWTGKGVARTGTGTLITDVSAAPQPQSLDYFITGF